MECNNCSNLRWQTSLSPSQDASMENVRPFFLFLHKFIDLKEQEFNDDIRPYLQVRHFRKRQPLCKIGEVEEYLNFILKGLVLKYYKKGDGDMVTQISFEGHIIHAQESFHSRTPSEYCIEAIEPTTVVSITYDNLEKIYAHSGKMEHLGRLIITYTMVIKDRWQMQLVMHTPRERFIHFVNRN